MVMLMWGKRLKHGKRGVRKNTEKALEMFTKAASKGSALAMVDAGLIHWEKGEKDKALDFYLMAAHLGNASAQCNLGISYLQGFQFLNL
jgi:TPR repeat protein